MHKFFQARITNIIFGTDGTANTQYNIVIGGFTEGQLCHYNCQCLQAICRSGSKFRKDKYYFVTTEIAFLGHTITEQGIEPYFNKVAASTELPNPTTLVLLIEGGR